MDNPDAFDEEWEDEPNGNGSNPEVNEASGTRDLGTDRPRLPTHDEDDDAIEGMSARLTTVRIEADPAAALSHEEPRQTILSRRNARRVSPPYAQSIPEWVEDPSTPSPDFQNYLRPITPSQPLISDRTSSASEEFPLDLSTSTPQGMLVSINDGPMTPTNNAGPFVFDGSAGRAGGRRAAANMSQETESAA